MRGKGVGVSHPTQEFQSVSKFGQISGNIFYKFIALKELYSLLNIQLMNKYK